MRVHPLLSCLARRWQSQQDMDDASLDSVAQAAAPAAADRSLPALIEELRRVVRQRHYSARTERGYVEWVERFSAWFDGRPPAELGEPEMRQFLAALAARPEISVGQRNLARNALVTWFHAVLGQQLDCRDGIGRAQPDGSVGPGQLTRAEVERLLAAMDGATAMPAALIYGTGLRLAEVLALRVRDFDLARRQIQVRDTRTGADLRTVCLPTDLVPGLQAHLEGLRRRHEDDLLKRAGFAQLPEPVRLSSPEAARAFGWQWVFQTGRLQRDPVSEEGRRPHMHEAVVQRALSAAGRALGLAFPVTPQTLRHSGTLGASEAEPDERAAA